MRSRPASSSAFSSAWMHRHVAKPTPAPTPPLHRPQPPSPQLRSPRGVPLYTVLMTRFSRTSTHPPRRFMQMLRRAASDASAMKYVSHDGRSRSAFSRSTLPSVAYRWARSGDVLTSRTVARDISESCPVLTSYRCASDLEMKSSSVVTPACRWWLAAAAAAADDGADDEALLFCCCHRCHRTVTGASTLMSRKKGRRLKASRAASDVMSVVTHRSRHRVVTKSSSPSVLSNTWCCGPFHPVWNGCHYNSNSLISWLPFTTAAAAAAPVLVL